MEAESRRRAPTISEQRARNERDRTSVRAACDQLRARPKNQVIL